MSRFLSIKLKQSNL